MTIVMVRWLRSLLLFLVAVGAPLYVVWVDEPGARQGREQDLEKLMLSNRRLRAEVTDMQRGIESLRTDPRVLEQVAREELGWIRDGEVVYRVNPPGGAP